MGTVCKGSYVSLSRFLFGPLLQSSLVSVPLYLHSGVRRGLVLQFVKVKIRLCVPHCSSSSQNPSPAAGLICSSQHSVLSLPELWRLRFNKPYFCFPEPPLPQNQIFIYQSLPFLISTLRKCQSILIKSLQISHGLICVRRFASVPPPPPHFRISTNSTARSWLLAIQPTVSVGQSIFGNEHRNIKSGLGGNQGRSLGT